MIDPADPQRKPLPVPDADTRAYWHGLREGKLLLQHCGACGHVQFYQQAVCRRCGAEALEHRPASGRGRVHSFSVVHRAPGPAFRGDVPYCVLLVDLDEGPRMISSFTGGDPMSVDFDMEVDLVCERQDESITLPRFRPARRA